MAIRQAAADDLPAVRALAGRYGLLAEWPVRPDWLDHLLAGGGLWIARAGDGAIAGFCGIADDGGVVHLSDLFVDPDTLGRGTGKALLEAAFPREGVRTTFSSGDPRALPLYTRAGLRPLAPMLYLKGAVPGGAAVQRIPVEAVPAERPATLAFLAGAGGYALRAGEGTAVLRPLPDSVLLGPAVAGADDLLALVGAASAAHGIVKLAIGGPHPGLEALLEAGLRIVDSDTYMASAPGVVDLERRLPHPDLG
jgi:GNAT superfamily N-acetyltransferase